MKRVEMDETMKVLNTTHKPNPMNTLDFEGHVSNYLRTRYGKGQIEKELGGLGKGREEEHK